MARSRRPDACGRSGEPGPRAGRPLAVVLVAALVASLPLLVWPAGPVEAATTALYLKASGVPKAGMSTAAPPAGPMANYDANRDSAPGLLLQKTDKGWGENDPKKHQLWVSSTAGQEIDGQVSLILWSAMKDFNDEKRGRVEAYLLECTSAGNSCSLVDQAALESEPWSSSGGWRATTLDFGSVTHSVAANRFLTVKLAVGDDSDDDMWFAYDTTTYPAQLTVETVDPTTTTTSTVTTITTTTTMAVTTTVAATTTTERGNNGRNPPGPPDKATTTTTVPNGASTSTSVPAATTTTEGRGSTTTTIALAGAPGPGSGGPGPDGPGPGETGGDAPVTDPDPSVSAMAAPAAEEAPSGLASTWSGSLVEHLELVMPPWAAGAVSSPLMVLGFVIDAMTDSGQAIVLPVALLMAGMIWVMFENRAFALSLFARDEHEEDDGP